MKCTAAHRVASSIVAVVCAVACNARVVRSDAAPPEDAVSAIDAEVQMSDVSRPDDGEWLSDRVDAARSNETEGRADVVDVATLDHLPALDATVDRPESDTVPAEVRCTAPLVACLAGAVRRCVDPTSDAAHCGACGNACASGSTCAWGECFDVEPPRRIAPHLSSRVRAGRPTFEWALPQGVDAARIQVCRDRACTDVVDEATVHAQTWQPASALADGLYFWRIAGVRGTAVGSRYGGARALRVGGTPTDDPAGLGISRDVNGDGLADFVIAWPLSGVSIHLGNRSGRPTVQRSLDGNGAHASIVGDLNGDGYADVVVGIRSSRSGGIGTDVSVARFYFGGADGVAAEPFYTLTNDAPLELLGIRVAPAGDIDGDGYADVIVRTRSRSLVLAGDRNGVTAVPMREIPGREVAPAGDVNGDGYADVLALAPEDRSSREVQVFLGSRGGLAASPDRAITGGVARDNFGLAAAGVGDVNDDGFGDVVIGAGYVASFGPESLDAVGYLFLGGASGISATPHRVLTVPLSQLPDITGGDFDRDGRADIVLSTVNHYCEVFGCGGRVTVFAGSSDGGPIQSMVPYDSVAAQSAATGAIAGDLNGDGFADLAVGTSGYRNRFDEAAGAAFVYPGSPSGVTMTPIAQWYGLNLPSTSSGAVVGFRFEGHRRRDVAFTRASSLHLL